MSNPSASVTVPNGLCAVRTNKTPCQTRRNTYHMHSRAHIPPRIRHSSNQHLAVRLPQGNVASSTCSTRNTISLATHRSSTPTRQSLGNQMFAHCSNITQHTTHNTSAPTHIPYNSTHNHAPFQHRQEQLHHRSIQLTDASPVHVCHRWVRCLDATHL